MSAYAGLRNIIIIGFLYGFHGLINRSLLIDGVNEIFLVTARISLVCIILGLYCIRDFINESVKHYNFDTYWVGKKENEKLKLKNNNRTIIKINKKFYRPNEVNNLLGSSNLIRKQLNWKPTLNFKELVKLMSLEDIKKNSSED